MKLSSMLGPGQGVEDEEIHIIYNCRKAHILMMKSLEKSNTS